MKKKLLLILLLASSGMCKAQSYTYSQDLLTYANLVSPTIVSTPGWDYFNTYTIPFPFHFQYFGAQFDTFYVAGGFGGFVYYGQNTFGDYEMYFYEASLIDRGFGLSTISYLTTGTAPNRILKLQIYNAGFENDVNETDYINVQVWFYETSNIIEMRYGPNSVVNPNSWDISSCQGPLVRLEIDSQTFIQLTGQSSNPGSSTSTTADCIIGAPPVDKVYIFTPTSTGINEINSSSLELYPNPNNGSFSLKSGNLEGEMNIFNTTGQLVYHNNLVREDALIQTTLSPGIYIVKINSGEKIYINKIVVN